MSVLLTGATGFLGMEVLTRLLDRDDDREIVAIVRATDSDRARERLDGVLRLLYDAPPASAARRLRAVPGDLCAEGLGLTPDDRRRVGDVTEVVHCAASISFSLPLAEALRVNVEGTRRVVSLARRLPRLRRLVHVSTAYVAGRHAGRFEERQLDVGQGFRNTYERSKHLAEVALRREARDLPLVVARPSIVVGDSTSGWTPAFNVLYWPLRAFHRGLLPRIPATPDGRLDIVPVDYVANALVRMLDDDVTGTLHLVSADRAITNRRLADLASRALDRPRPTLGPSDALERKGGEVYLPYLDVETSFDDRRARAALAPAGISAPAPEGYFDRLMAYAVRARWGRRPQTREQALAAAA
jgi:thioester reductase-like protein